MTPADLPLELVHALQTRGYTIERALGEGGMGTVWLARSARGEALAVKVPSSDDPRTIERFHREAEITRTLAEVPGVVRGITGSLDPPRWLGLEYIPGETLKQRLASGPMPEETLLRRIAEVADTLAEAHTLGVIHRDLKPSNILVDERTGEARLADFGVALALAEDSLTKTGELVGSVHTMAPEQIGGVRHAIGPATDLWALGVLLYEGLCGVRPFHGPTVTALAAAICQAKPRPISERCERLRPETVRLIEDCLRLDPDQRLADAGEFADRCRRALAQQPTAPARSPGRPLAMALALTTLLAVIAGGLVEVHGSRRRALAARELRRHAGQLRATLREALPRHEAWLTEEANRAIELRPPQPPFEPGKDLRRLHRLLALRLREAPRTPDEDALEASRLWRLATRLCVPRSPDELIREARTPRSGADATDEDRRLDRMAALPAALRAGRLDDARALVTPGSQLAERLHVHARAVKALTSLATGRDDLDQTISGLDHAARDPRLGEFTRALWRSLSKRRLARLEDPAEIIALSRRAHRHADALDRLGGLEWSPKALAILVEGWLREQRERDRPPTAEECEELARRVDRGPHRPPIDIPLRNRAAILRALTSGNWTDRSPGRTPAGVPTCTLEGIAARLCSVGLMVDALFYGSPIDTPAPAWLKTGCHPVVATCLRLSTDRLKGRLKLVEEETRKRSYVSEARESIIALLKQELPRAIEAELIVLLAYIEDRLCRTGVSTELHAPRHLERLPALADDHPLPFRARIDLCWFKVTLAVARGRLERRSEGLSVPPIEILDLARIDPLVARVVRELPAELDRTFATFTGLDSPAEARRRLESENPKALVPALESLNGTIRARVRLALMIQLETILRSGARVPGGLLGAVKFTDPSGVALERKDVTMDQVERDVYRARLAVRNGEEFGERVRGVSLKVASVRTLLDSILALDRARADAARSGQ